jgi:hypothetical protein
MGGTPMPSGTGVSPVGLVKIRRDIGIRVFLLFNFNPSKFLVELDKAAVVVPGLGGLSS